MSTALSGRTARLLLFVVSIAALAWTLGVVVFGTVDLIAQLANDTIRPTMYWADDFTQFTDEGDGHTAVRIAGAGGAIVTSVTGVSGGTVAIFAASTIARLVIQLVLGGLALALMERLRSGRPFRDAAWRLVAAASVGVLALGVASQLLSWWSRVAIIGESRGIGFSTAFVFDPATVSLGLVLVLVAVAFRVGEHLQRDAEGLV